MRTKEAVALRIVELTKTNNLTINALANIAGMSSGTIYSMLNSKSQNPGVVSIKKICDGLNITLSDFFDSDIFDDLDCEIGALHRKRDKPCILKKHWLLEYKS